jgi:hypothetical protein
MTAVHALCGGHERRSAGSNDARSSNTREDVMSKAFDWSTSVAYDAPRKASLHFAGRARLRLLAKELGLPKDSFDIRSNKGGIAVSGECILHAEKIYVQVSQSVIGRGMGILIRKCNGRKDYTGSRNHWLPLDRLNDIPALARYVRTVLLDSIWMETPAEYRSLIDGKRYILELQNGATCLVPLETSDKAKLG